MSPTKILTIVGITGNQGSSVAHRFLQDPNYHIRGITRNPSSPAAQTLAQKGIKIIPADLDDVSSLKTAFAGSTHIFSVTNYWEPFFRTDYRQQAAQQRISCRRYAYDVERQQGQNIADAAASTVDTLDENGFIASTLSHARKASKGVFQELYHFDAKADIFPNYVQEKHPRLAQKMSCVQTGFFMTSHKLVPDAYFHHADDGSCEMAFPTAPHSPVPHFDVNADMGTFVYAVSQMPPRKRYLAEGTTCSWSEYLALWSKVTSMEASYRQISLQELIEGTPDKEFGREVGDMLLYSTSPGYDGGDERLLRAVDIRKAGIECPMTTLEEFMEKEDWSAVLQKFGPGTQ
ncbi:uncharacterized protein KD926_004914 [Aspergillus affinis]|uniref:uncharacterized protein n=1 Tax=Aspergillus affinis TaxID=1070780 RepID=UPI0022FED3BF|nr:uncharacterized protein KD926_004914 [Aspergillus affinis]KAI9042848.1 hypothetical protein KD926_004914 [Aspergillus affinis]